MDGVEFVLTLVFSGGKWNKQNFSVETTKALASMIYGSKWNSSSKVQNETGTALCHGVYASEIDCDSKASSCTKQKYDATLAKEVKGEEHLLFHIFFSGWTTDFQPVQLSSRDCQALHLDSY